MPGNQFHTKFPANPGSKKEKKVPPSSDMPDSGYTTPPLPGPKMKLGVKKMEPVVKAYPKTTM